MLYNQPMSNPESLVYDVPERLPETVEINNLPNKYKDFALGVITAYSLDFPSKPTHISVIGNSDEDLDAISQAVMFEDGKKFPTMMLKSGEPLWILDN
jgi:hypothetical protein